MSYILEALKKAQAERQLGNAPTIHAAQPVPALQPDAAASRRPLFIGLGAGALVVVLGAAFVWRAGPAQVPAVQVAQGQGQSPAAVTAVPVTPAPMAAAGSPAAGSPATGSPAAGSPAVSNSLEVQAPPAPPPPVRPAQPRVADAAAAAAVPAAAASRAAATPSAPAVQVRMPAPAPATPVAAVAARAAAPAAAAPAPEDSLPFLQQLPESVQGGIPRVAFGGYMYSANPADRLLLVDKALRHEGEEVAPGLVLEKLLPRAAVMNYRGVRYRVAY
ncbi:general secretion pathway protein GspB [Herbaspirillum sp. SJZ107]|uniref:general secretion pathway protein GspB n=1 Tax=Herbaspirillum sp. SJZ107 TaxID=2572881 RepID=UPI00114F0D85|nr:general secretion pathway protein GspB [Herbaspirillum sp. SJZ107]TQK10424.1 type II secretion system protein B [Herbaspirillum sp. SJZ107]